MNSRMNTFEKKVNDGLDSLTMPKCSLILTAINARAQWDELQLEVAEGNSKETILSKHGRSQEEIKNYMDCLKTAYQYYWGEEAYNKIEKILHQFENYKINKMVECSRKKALA
uniref:Uncharacterized protein n=1 Tax=Trichobilharzia regenti TaxID=157069 RepID=A0AA85IY87_TRIRE|nr:unnamed protein product [Trichobilharzia regenti]